MNDGQGGIAIGLANGISVAVFQIDKWEKVAERKNRWTFSGTDISLNSELCNRNYSRIIRGNGYWQRGSYVVVAFDGPKKEFKFLHGSKDKEWRDLLKT